MSLTRKLQQTLAAVASCLTLIGCAAAPAKGWRVEGTYRLDGTGASAAAGYLALGRQYQGEARHHLALDAYRKAARLAPGDADVMNALGLALAQQSMLAPAIDAFRQALALDPERPALLNNLGYALVLDKRMDEGRTFLQQALVQEPGHQLARVNLDRLVSPEPATQVAGPAMADAAELGTDGHLNAPALRSEASASAENPPLTVQFSFLPNVEAFSVTFADSQATGPQSADSEGRAQLEAPPPLPFASEKDRPPQGAAKVVAVRLEISNGNGVRGMGARLGQSLRSLHPAYAIRLTNMRRFDRDTTVVEYRPGFTEEARVIADSLSASTLIHAVEAAPGNSDIRVLLGRDVKTAGTCVACTPGASKIRVAAALRSSPRLSE